MFCPRCNDVLCGCPGAAEERRALREEARKQQVAFSEEPVWTAEEYEERGRCAAAHLRMLRELEEIAEVTPAEARAVALPASVTRTETAEVTQAKARAAAAQQALETRWTLERADLANLRARTEAQGKDRTTRKSEEPVAAGSDARLATAVLANDTAR